MPAFWSHADANQSAASATGYVPPRRHDHQTDGAEQRQPAEQTLLLGERPMADHRQGTGTGATDRPR